MSNGNGHLSLFDIERTLVELVDRWQEAETSEEIEIAETAIRVYVEQEVRKVDGIRRYLKFCETQSAAAKAEAALQRSRQAQWEARRERLKAFVFDVMTSFRVRKLEGETGTLQIKGNGGLAPLSIVSDELVPDEYCMVSIRMSADAWNRIKPGIKEVCEAGPREPNNSMIRAALAAGEGVPGCRLGERAEHLEIR